MGKIVRAINKNHTIRMFAIDSTDMVQKAAEIHQTTPVASAALGRTVTAASMMGVMMKNDKDKLTFQIKGDGPLKGVVAVAYANGQTKAYPLNPWVDIPLKENGKLDVSGAVGKGKLTVIKDFGLKEPYIGQTNLVTGEIAEDLTAYYAYSEQQPSAVALGVLVDKDHSIKAAGGFIVQLMPDTAEEEIDQLEKNLSSISSVSHLIEEGKTPEDIIKIVLKGMDPVINDTLEVEYKCDCSRERLEEALISIGISELEDILANEKETQLQCHFCNKEYKFTEQDLKKIVMELKNQHGGQNV